MKNKEQKCKEAVDRNIASAIKSKKYKRKGLQATRQALGIKPDDTNYDKQMKELIG